MILNPESAPEERVNFVGHCIYCGVTGDVAELGDGHVAPAGLMGVFILKKASCKKHGPVQEYRIHGIGGPCRDLRADSRGAKIAAAREPA